MMSVLGLAEAIASFELAAELCEGAAMEEALHKLADRVRDDSIEEISAYSGASLSTIVSRVSRPTRAGVYQNARKRGGKHPDFGRLQLRKMERALDENEDHSLEVAATLVEGIKRATGL